MEEYPKTLFKNGEAKECRTNGDEAQARAQGYTEPYKYQEYPKHLYRDGLPVVFDKNDIRVSGEDRIVNDKSEEDAAREDGFAMIGEAKPDPALAYLPPEILAAVRAAGKDSIVGKALLAQYPAPTDPDAKAKKGEDAKSDAKAKKGD